MAKALYGKEEHIHPLNPKEKTMHYDKVNNLLQKMMYVLMIMTPVGIIIMLFPELKGKYLWTTNIFLSFQFIALLCYMFLNYTQKSVFITIPVMIVSGYLLEYIGVKTSFPFGSYIYTDTLQPQIFGVPLAISLSWVVVVAGSYLIISSVKSFNLFAVVIYSSVLVLAFDLLLEPFASFINGYWIWTFSFVPIQNYISWFAVAAVFTVILEKYLVPLTGGERKSKVVSNIPLILYLISVFQFSFVNVFNSYILPTVSGIALIIIVSIIIYRRTNEV